MFTNNYFLNGYGALPWYNLGFTQFLRHGHNKLTITQIQCSQRYKKLVEKFWLRNFLVKVAKYGLWLAIYLNFKLWVGIVCLDNPSYLHFPFHECLLFLHPKREKNTHTRTLWLGKRSGLIQGYIVLIQNIYN
jgi:hypothetical protein